MGWKLRKKKPAPPAHDRVAEPASLEDEPRPGPKPAASGPRRTVLPDGVIVEEGPGGRTFTIPATPSRRGIGDPCWWRRR
jgi:hypothetical protein